MNRLGPAIAHFEKASRPLWTFRKREITVGDLHRFTDLHSSLLAMHGRVAVFIEDLVDLASTLVSLQGRADQVLLVPHGTPRDLMAEFIQRSGTNLLITDEKNLDITVELYHLAQTEKTADPVMPPPASIETKIIIPTSGTTGVPKLVSHTQSSLTRTTTANQERGGEYCWGLLYDVLRFAGLQVFLQSLLGGSTLVLTSNDDPLDARLDQLVQSGCNALSATPTMWRKILMLHQSDELPMKQITLGGEIVDDMILKALHHKFPRARITHIYASTEAGVGFSVNDMKAGFPVDFLDHPPNNVAIRVDDNGFMYLKKHEQNEQHYIGSKESLADEQGFINTGDLVRREGDRFLFLGRANGAINVGGNKVQPEEVELVLLQHPGVEFAKVDSVKSSMMGELVTATVKARERVEDPASFKTELLSFCASRLEPFKVPSMLQFTDEVELNASGKMKRNER